MDNLWLIIFLNWLHLLATVVWIGGIFCNVIVTFPAARKTLEPKIAGAFIGTVGKRFRVIIYISMIVLLGSGTFLNFIDENFFGPMTFSHSWLLHTFIKHALVAILVVLTLYAFEIGVPKIRKLAAKGPSPELEKAQRIQMAVGYINLCLGIIILLLSSIMLYIA